MNFNLAYPKHPSRNFAARFQPPYTQYIVGPRKPEDAPYMVDLDFAQFPLDDFVRQYQPETPDILEVFTLVRRVQLTGLRIEVVSPAPIVLMPVTNSGISFVPFDCSEVRDETLVANGTILTTNTDLEQTAVVIDDPDYLGLMLLDGAEYLPTLSLRLQLVVSDTFPYNARTNSVKKDGFGR